MLGYLLSMHFNVLSSKPVRKRTDLPKRGTGLVTWQSRVYKARLLKELVSELFVIEEGRIKNKSSATKFEFDDALCNCYY